MLEETSIITWLCICCWVWICLWKFYDKGLDGRLFILTNCPSSTWNRKSKLLFKIYCILCGQSGQQNRRRTQRTRWRSWWRSRTRDRALHLSRRCTEAAEKNTARHWLFTYAWAPKGRVRTHYIPVFTTRVDRPCLHIRYDTIRRLTGAQKMTDGQLNLAHGPETIK